jgi:hypothetical protein
MSPKPGVTATISLAGGRHTGRMGAHLSSWIVGLARRVRRALSEIHRANVQANAYLLSYGLVETDRAPDTYAEFLLRTRAAALHEPPAGRR